MIKSEYYSFHTVDNSKLNVQYVTEIDQLPIIILGGNH